MPEYFDDLETRDPAVRERELFAQLPQLIEHAQQNAPAVGEMLAGYEPAEISDRNALAQLPVLRKSELLIRQKGNRPFGGFATKPVNKTMRIYGSPGPIYEPEVDKPDYWRLARALFAAGFRADDIVHNAFSYHFTPAGAMLESGAFALGCAVFPAGVGQTELQAQTIAELKPTGYVGTPSFLRIILDKAAELGHDTGSLNKALVSGEALPPSLRATINGHGISILQCYATADVGLIAYESEAQEGLIVDEQIIVEIVRPGTNEPVSEGEVGEVVVTTFNEDYPLIRFGTGDLSAILPEHSPCGRTNLRIKGWMGRADQTAKVRGMFVHPSQVHEVVKRHPQISRARLVVDNDGTSDIMILQCEASDGSDSLAEAIANSIRDVCKLRGSAKFVKPGSLPNDGKVIDDIRTYE
ncbi:MAG: AMP-binding protein [Arenicellales bacterium]|nr:AMP-binding protein [Arenicellales bacterium]